MTRQRADRIQQAIAIARNDARIFRREPVWLLIQVATPIVLIAFLQPALKAALVQFSDRSDVTGAEQVVPGMLVMFGFFVVFSWVGTSFYREFSWQTWDRLRINGGTGATLVVGKLVVPVCLGIVHAAVVLTAGVVFFDLRIGASILSVVVIALATLMTLAGFAFAAIAWTKSFAQFSTITNLGALTFAGLGGALVPIEALPSLARDAAPALPTYWAMRSYHTILLDHGGLSDVVGAVGLIIGMGIAFATAGAVKFNSATPRRGFS